MIRPIPVLASALVLLSPVAALAHPGAHMSGFTAGLSHPPSGADHVLAMVAVGLWASMAGGRALWAAPAAFVGAMLVGAACGLSGWAVPAVEPAILASVIVMGGMLAFALRLPLAAALPVIAVFGFVHGAAHGMEGPTAGAAAFVAGFVMATAALHIAGIALGLALARGGDRTLRALGGGMAALGVGMALGFGA